MSAVLRILSAGPLASLQDAGRFGMLAHGVAASGPMDRGAFFEAAALLGAAAPTGIEFAGSIGLACVEGRVRLGWAGGNFEVRLDGERLDWPGVGDVTTGATLRISPGHSGNWGYLRFDAEPDMPELLSSRSTNTRLGLGGCLLRNDDRLVLVRGPLVPGAMPAMREEGPIRIVWGLHADRFGEIRHRFLEAQFRVTPAMDRMGVRLADSEGVFAGCSSLGLVSEPLVAGDIQVLGDGTPVVLMRDHQPTGGYPRIATIVSADLDRFAQLRPGATVQFAAIGVEAAQALPGGAR